MIKLKDYNFSKGSLLITLLISLAIVFFLIFGIYFGFNRIQISKNNPLSPLNAIEKAKEAKDFIESRQKSLENQ